MRSIKNQKGLWKPHNGKSVDNLVVILYRPSARTTTWERDARPSSITRRGCQIVVDTRVGREALLQLSSQLPAPSSQLSARAPQRPTGGTRVAAKKRLAPGSGLVPEF
ncbi:hypothetical protein N7539_001499 [Penicillium diatomitis]|uniref:Uncharacterized protein n=1 Tax=Penicillium diatomitis TaxID=2819901 RepID=A0A9W9XGS8_9EURO|nr:uncharacterized protein N7539_001499 [Penicillium diatomitis]KAJ5492753.1 hypothetical protein N7539_001499 [Penicillium diatomitis]